MVDRSLSQIPTTSGDDTRLAARREMVAYLTKWLRTEMGDERRKVFQMNGLLHAVVASLYKHGGASRPTHDFSHFQILTNRKDMVGRARGANWCILRRNRGRKDAGARRVAKNGRDGLMGRFANG